MYTKDDVNRAALNVRRNILKLAIDRGGVLSGTSLLIG